MSHNKPLDEDQLAKRLEQAHQQMLEQAAPEVIDTSDVVEIELAPVKNFLKLIEQVKKQTIATTPAAKSFDESTIRDHGTHSIQRKSSVGNAPTHKTLTAKEREFVDRSSIRNIARFDIHELLGQGGFGIVYRGFDPDLDREVAIKIPRAETLLTEDSRRRFVQEAKTAAALSHPNIVTVFESGTHDSIIFQVSEYVRGETLANWLTRHNRFHNPADAARTIATLADALQHAHTRGIIHRDIKPANIFLAGVDEQKIEEAELWKCVKLGDFGLAKFVTDQAQTKAGALVGTPAYMAPEQISSRENVVGPRADVYSLGVLLYELLTGTTPFARANLHQTVSAVEREVPPAPSRQNPLVSRDLDAIVLKCLEKSVEARYSSAVDLRIDLERFLNHEPVLARKLTPAVRLSRWVVRNKLATGLMFALLAGVVGTSVGMVWARHAEAQAKTAEARAKIEARTALVVSDYLVDLFEVTDLLGQGRGEKKNGREITADQLLMRGVSNLQTKLNDEPEVQARLMTTVGNILINLGMLEEAEPLLKDALAVRLELLEPDDPAIAASHHALGRCYRDRDQFDDAKKHFDKAIVILENDTANNHRELARTYNDLGVLFSGNNKIDEAKSAYLNSRDLILLFNSGGDNLWALDANIATLDIRAGKFDLAKPRLEGALEDATNVLGPNHPQLGKILDSLAAVHRHFGDYEQAFDFQKKGFDLARMQLGDDHPQVGISAIGMVVCCQRLGNYELAEEYGELAIELIKKCFPSDHRNVSIAFNIHALTFFRTGKYSKAREFVEEALEVLALRTDDNANLALLKNLIFLANIERLDGESEVALKYVDEVLSHPQLEQWSSVKVDAALVRGFVMAQLNDPNAEKEFAAAMEYNVAKMTAWDFSYAEARFWALMGNQEKALTKLELAIEQGYRDAALLDDPDLELIRTDARYVKIAIELKRYQSDNTPP